MFSRRDGAPALSENSNFMKPDSLGYWDELEELSKSTAFGQLPLGRHLRVKLQV